MKAALAFARRALSSLVDLIFPPDEMPQHSNYSAVVDLTLYVDGYSLPVSHVGHQGLILSILRAKIPPCDALLVVSVDGRLTEYPIRLVEGASNAGEWLRFVKRV